MARACLTAAALLSLAPHVLGCSCLAPDPLSECPVRDGSVALLVTVQCVKSVQCDLFSGSAVADVLIEQVFQDNTNSNFTFVAGDMVTVRSGLQSSLCGVGRTFEPGTQIILFASVPPPPFEFPLQVDDGSAIAPVPETGPLPEDPDDEETGGNLSPLLAPLRRLMQGISTSVSASASPDTTTFAFAVGGDYVEQDGLFSDGSFCDIMSADLATSLCSSNIINPSPQNITDLMMACSTGSQG